MKLNSRRQVIPRCRREFWAQHIIPIAEALRIIVAGRMTAVLMGT
jgi:hypothetical protein